MHRFLEFTIAASVALCAGVLDAASPQLNSIAHPGMQRGQERVLTFRGNRLQDVEEALLHSPGVAVKKIEAVDDRSVRVTLEASPDCRLGEHLVQLRTRTGISDFRSFFVGALPAVEEAEPNDSREAPQTITPNVCVEGVLKSEDRDCFRFPAAKGERLSIEVEGIRLGQALFDPHVTIVNPAGEEIAVCDDTVLTKQDPFLSLLVPEDGEYTIVLRDASYRGAENARYRLHIGRFPRPAVAYPVGGKRGETIKLQFLGDATGPIEREIAVPADATADHPLFVEDEHGVSPSPLAFRASAFDNIMEAEPNNGFDDATRADPPLVLSHSSESGASGIAFNGRLEQSGDTDFFKFTALKDEVWEIECYAQRIGSPADPVIHIFDAQKKTLSGNDDSRKQDSYLRWQAPADGEYYLRVREHRERGGETHVYRVEMTPVVPSLKVGIPRVARYTQERQTIVVPRGNRYATLILATRADCTGPVELLNDGLPPGLSFTSRPMHPSLNLMPVVFEAAEDASVSGALVDLSAKLEQDGKTVEGGFENVADFVRGDPNNAIYVHGTVYKLAMAVAEKVPYRLEIVEPKVPLVRHGTMQLKVLVHRDEGFTAPLQLRCPFVPSGVGAIGTVSVPEGANEAVYPLNANAKAMLGKWPIMVLGAADLNGQAWVSSQLAELEVAESYVEFEIKRAACHRGGRAQLLCTITHNTPFEGTAKAELLGLPPGASAEPREFTHEASELVFEIATTAETPLGRHKGILCQATITQNGEPIVSTVGTAELQVIAPSASATTANAEQAPPAKALSRLQQLRAQLLNAEKKEP